MVDGFSCILDFPKFSRGGPPDPPYKGNQLNPQNLSSTTQRQNKNGKPSPIKTICKKFIFGLYRNWKMEKGAGARCFFVWFVIGLFETLICATAEDKVCGSCVVSSWALLIFLLCLWWPNSNFMCCVIKQNGESSRDLLLSVTNRKALAPGGLCPSAPPFWNINYITTSHFLTTRPAVGRWLGKKVSSSIGYLLTMA